MYNFLFFHFISCDTNSNTYTWAHKLDLFFSNIIQPLSNTFELPSTLTSPQQSGFFIMTVYLSILFTFTETCLQWSLLQDGHAEITLICYDSSAIEFLPVVPFGCLVTQIFLTNLYILFDVHLTTRDIFEILECVSEWYYNIHTHITVTVHTIFTLCSCNSKKIGLRGRPWENLMMCVCHTQTVASVMLAKK